MWIKLLAPKTIEIHGTPTSFQKGDWADIGGHLARLWISQGAATADQTVASNRQLPDCGIVAIGQAPRLGSAMAGATIQTGTYGTPIPEPKSLYWRDAAPIAQALIPVGLMLLERWEVAVPLQRYDLLAADIGTEEDRAAAVAEICDLRVPLYDTRALFLRQCPAATELLETWEEIGGHRDLAFLRALWRVAPLICALPAEWMA